MATPTLTLISPAAIAPAAGAGGEGSVPSPSTSLSLRSLVEELDALAETVECVEPADEAEFLERFAETHLATRQKIDRTGDFLDFIAGQIAAAK